MRARLVVFEAHEAEDVQAAQKAIAELGKVIIELTRSGAIKKLAAHVAEQNADGFLELLRELKLERFCFQICRLICALRCGVYCRLVCPPACDLFEPEGCVEESDFPAVNIFRGVEIKGTAAGPFCHHYTLEWREAGAPAWRSEGIHYAGPDPDQGTCGVLGDTLGWLATYPTVPTGPVEIRLCVYSRQDGVAPSCCILSFELARNLVWISSLEGIRPALRARRPGPPPRCRSPTARAASTRSASASRTPPASSSTTCSRPGSTTRR